MFAFQDKTLCVLGHENNVKYYKIRLEHDGHVSIIENISDNKDYNYVILNFES